MRCLIPIDVSPASKIPGVSLARGSVASEPIIPGGKAGAGSAANGFTPSSVFCFAGEGDAEGACAWLLPAKHAVKTSEAINKAVMCTRFISSPLRFLTQHRLHNPNLSALAAIDIGGEIK